MIQWYIQGVPYSLVMLLCQGSHGSLMFCQGSRLVSMLDSHLHGDNIVGKGVPSSYRKNIPLEIFFGRLIFLVW